MTSANAWRAEQRAKRTLTPLNLRISALYSACMANGGHTPSGDSILREFPVGQRQLPLCKRCGVPYGKTSGYWGNPTSGAKGGRG